MRVEAIVYLSSTRFALRLREAGDSRHREQLGLDANFVAIDLIPPLQIVKLSFRVIGTSIWNSLLEPRVESVHDCVQVVPLSSEVAKLSRRRLLETSGRFGRR